MPKGVRAVVLSEDLQGWVFAYRMLIKLGYEPRNIRPVPVRDGRGSGEQHVRTSYPNELHSCRSRAAKTALVVHIDADTRTVRERHTILDSELKQKGIRPRSSEDTVAILVPRRNIETWVHFYLDRTPVDEQTEYPKYTGCESETWDAAYAFADHVRAGKQPAGAPPSLIIGLEEARRVR